MFGNPLIDIGQLPREQQLQLLAELFVKLFVPPPPPAPADAALPRLLKIPEVAEVLGCSASYVYELVKRGDPIAVRDVDYVRVRLEALNDFIDQHEKCGPLDLTLCNVISSGLDRRRNQGGPQSAAVDPGRPGRRNRRAPDNAISLGARRDRGPGAGGEVG
jgi:excisionase family DNA binding protein